MNHFPPEYIHYLLSINLHGDVRGGMDNYGHHRSLHAGSSVEFQDFRPYAPGDDLRRIDANIYQRHHKLFIRRYRHFQQVTYYVVLDNSASLHFEPERFHAAIQITAAIAVPLLNHGNRVNLFITGENSFREFKNGKNEIPQLLQQLDSLSGHSGSDGELLRKPLRARLNNNSVTWIVSDFFAAADTPDRLEPLRHLPGTRIPVRIGKATDRTPELNGNLQLVDCETGNHLNAAVDADVIRAYQRSYDRFILDLDTFARHSGAHHYGIDAALPDIPRTAPLFPQGALNSN